MASRYITRIKASDIKSSLPDLFKILSIVSIVQIQQTVCKYKARIRIARHACATRNKVWPPPSFIKTSWSLNYFPGISKSWQTDTKSRSRQYITRAKDWVEWTLEKPQHVKNSVLPRCVRQQWIQARISIKKSAKMQNLGNVYICGSPFVMMQNGLYSIFKRLWEYQSNISIPILTNI
jgi:hypothetical protein